MSTFSRSFPSFPEKKRCNFFLRRLFWINKLTMSTKRRISPIRSAPRKPYRKNGESVWIKLNIKQNELFTDTISRFWLKVNPSRLCMAIMWVNFLSPHFSKERFLSTVVLFEANGDGHIFRGFLHVKY